MVCPGARASRRLPSSRLSVGKGPRSRGVTQRRSPPAHRQRGDHVLLVVWKSTTVDVAQNMRKVSVARTAQGDESIKQRRGALGEGVERMMRLGGSPH